MNKTIIFYVFPLFKKFWLRCWFQPLFVHANWLEFRNDRKLMVRIIILTYFNEKRRAVVQRRSQYACVDPCARVLVIFIRFQIRSVYTQRVAYVFMLVPARIRVAAPRLNR